MASDKVDLSAKLDNISTVDDIRAVAPGAAVVAADHQEAATVAAASGVDAGEAQAFEQAGWTFVKADKTVDADAAHGVVVDGDGHLKILSNALNVRFDPELSRSAVEGILGEHDLSIRRDMGFAPNLFLVTGVGGNTVTKAKSLNELDSVVYAEPVLIEPLKGR
ncbi:MAG: hypothetical protein ABWY14_15010 [Tardiphaga sp.]